MTKKAPMCPDAEETVMEGVPVVAVPVASIPASNPSSFTPSHDMSQPQQQPHPQQQQLKDEVDLERANVRMNDEFQRRDRIVTNVLCIVTFAVGVVLFGAGIGTVWSTVPVGGGSFDVALKSATFWVGFIMFLSSFIFCGWGIGISAKLCAGGHRTSRDPKLSQKLQNDAWRRSGLIVGLLVLFVVMIFVGIAIIAARVMGTHDDQFLHEAVFWIAFVFLGGSLVPLIMSFVWMCRGSSARSLRYSLETPLPISYQPYDPSSTTPPTTTRFIVE